MSEFIDPNSGIIVIDPGHGGIDGGTTRQGILEKDINLDISQKLKVYLEQMGYKVVMTRENDMSLENLSGKDGTRHQKDLNARVDIINSNNAQLFLSIHGNCHVKNLNADGSLVFFNNRFQQNKTLAYCVQRALNNIIVDGKKRTIHDPVEGNYFLLNNAKIPGAIVETGFLTNEAELRYLMRDSFRDQIAIAIAQGVYKYLVEQKRVDYD
ncbi:MAG: N-acetylmuramoyl-L-alanine amidase [Bacillota bacterium]|nr:N-acetylmuramoyl-L-alanine amidase [Bacillota bacterium]